MSRPSSALRNHRQPSSIVDNYEVIDELVMKPTSGRTSRQLSTDENDQWDNNNRTIRKLITDQPLNPYRSRSSSNTSLKSMVIEGKWKYREQDDDRLRLESKGIEHLVTICHDIMTKTLESPSRKQEKRTKFHPKNQPWPVVKLDEFKKITTNDRNTLKRAGLFQLMTIVYEATATNASISQLVRIWREASKHNSRARRLKSSQNQPLISYEQAFQHLIRKPDNHLLQIALHASIISTHNRSDLQRLGKNLGIGRNQFDMNSICDSTRDFQNLIKFLREQKLKQKREQQHINTKELPYERIEKQGLYANVSGTRFRLRKSFF